MVKIKKSEKKAPARKKGRNKELIERRNMALVKRFFYHSEIKRRRTDDVLRILSQDEFFLTEQVIWRTIMANQPLLDELYKLKPTDEQN
jgi:hypothetical protein